MDCQIDLDLAAEAASAKIAALTMPGLQVDPLTWRDADEPWPQKFRTDRRSVSNPDSFGIRARRAEAEGSLVLFDGGWTDLMFFDPRTEVEIIDSVGWDERLDLDSYASLVDRFFGLFR
ncbi:hypothetical protein [Herbiconiux ginsengi]|uniref:Uncharacterized protein n=1 Tax=Herbiconiux ginsengi TaxID=381665 RepID=A0A1H3S554_9MICO|nr:hypothetical protein [Herbiconiux ginsengi]SDZ32621.1 hypothetical protein SAMN05216554_3286 [Herbiconiux ginsengi]